MLPPPGLVVSSTNTFLDVVPTLLTSAAFAIATANPTAAMPSPTSIAAGALAAGSDNGPHDNPPNGECSLLGPFALIVQAALGGLALMALVFKRWRERPQRPLKIWSFDVSKQVVGSVLVHIANLLMSLLSSGQFSIAVAPSTVQTRGQDKNGTYQPNPCSFYLLNLAIDVSIYQLVLKGLPHANTHCLDHCRYSDLDCASSYFYCTLPYDSRWQPTRIHSIWQLWLTPKNLVVG